MPAIERALNLTNGIALPAGHRFRLATPDDFAAIAGLKAACLRAIGENHGVEAREVESDWTTPGCDLGRDCVLVESPDGEIVGYEEVFDRQLARIWDCEAGCVHPSARGKGIAEAMLAWAERRVEISIPDAPPGTEVRLQAATRIPGGEEKCAMLEGAGYERVRTFLRMRLDLAEEAPAPEWPDGIDLRTLRPDDPDDTRAFFDAMADSFHDHWGVLPGDRERGFARFRHSLDTPDFDPALFCAAMAGDEIAGICFCWRSHLGDPETSYLSHVGVLPRWRRRGLARALLRHAFRERRAGGWKRVGLGVDEQNGSGAVALYLQEGMEIVRRFVVYGKALREGETT